LFANPNISWGNPLFNQGSSGKNWEVKKTKIRV
jgi:hypothetical protein